MPVLIILHSFFWIVFSGLRAYTIGLWFLCRHPIQFISFVNEWRGYAKQIADTDDAAAAGYFSLNRAQRRKLSR